METKSDVIVVGSGIVGSATSYYLSKKGKKVICLEASDIICNGGSVRNAGGVRQSGRDPKELPLMIWGVKNLWPHLSEELEVDTEYKQKGNLRLGKTETHLKKLQTLADNCVKQGVQVQMLSSEQVKKINPYLSDLVIGASWCATDGHANPLTTSLGFYKAARKNGVQYYSNCPVKKIITKGGKVFGVETQEQIFLAPTVVVAAGYESNQILNTVGINIPMFKKTLQSLVTEAEPQMFEQMLGTADADFYGHQTKHGSFVFGGHDGTENTPIKIDNKYPYSSASFSSACARGILSYFPKLANAKIVRAWAGYEDQCQDGVAVVSKCDEVSGLYIECGFSGHGFGIAPSAAYNIAELICTDTCPADISPLRYNRFKPTV